MEMFDFKNKILFRGVSTIKWNSYPTLLKFQVKSPIGYSTAAFVSAIIMY